MNPDHAPAIPETAPPPAAPPGPASPAPVPPFVKPKFGGLLLVCSDCQRRSSGPTKHSAKEWRSELKKAVGHQPTRWRIVESTCLGLCPRKATAIAAAVTGGPVRLAEVRRKGDLQALAEGLTATP